MAGSNRDIEMCSAQSEQQQMQVDHKTLEDDFRVLKFDFEKTSTPAWPRTQSLKTLHFGAGPHPLFLKQCSTPFLTCEKAKLRFQVEQGQSSSTHTDSAFEEFASCKLEFAECDLSHSVHNDVPYSTYGSPIDSLSLKESKLHLQNSVDSCTTGYQSSGYHSLAHSQFFSGLSGILSPAEAPKAVKILRTLENDSAPQLHSDFSVEKNIPNVREFPQNVKYDLSAIPWLTEPMDLSTPTTPTHHKIPESINCNNNICSNLSNGKIDAQNTQELSHQNGPNNAEDLVSNCVTKVTNTDSSFSHDQMNFQSTLHLPDIPIVTSIPFNLPAIHTASSVSPVQNIHDIEMCPSPPEFTNDNKVCPSLAQITNNFSTNNFSTQIESVNETDNHIQNAACFLASTDSKYMQMTDVTPIDCDKHHTIHKTESKCSNTTIVRSQNEHTDSTSSALNKKWTPHNERFKAVIAQHSPAVPDRLIGRRMGLEKVDIMKELGDLSLCPVIASILRMLSPEDLLRMSKVSPLWSRLVDSDPHAIRQKKLAISEMTRFQEFMQKENQVDKETKRQTRNMTASGLPFGTLQYKMRASASPQLPSNTSTKNHTVAHQRYWKVASKLKIHESLRKCPRCQQPARHHKEMERASCCNPQCQFTFCTNCFNAFHGSTACLNSPVKRNRLAGPIGSSKSKRNLKRL